MRPSSRHRRETRRRQPGFFVHAKERVCPCGRKKATQQRHRVLPNRLQAGVEISQCVIGRESAEVNAQRQYQLNQASPRFTKLQDRSPKKIREHQPHEIEILRELESKMGENSMLRLAYDCVRKPSRAAQQYNRSQTEVSFDFHFVKNQAVKIEQGEIQPDRQKSVGVEIKVRVLRRRETVMLNNLEAPYTCQERKPHINIQKEIPAK